MTSLRRLSRLRTVQIGACPAVAASVLTWIRRNSENTTNCAFNAGSLRLTIPLPWERRSIDNSSFWRTFGPEVKSHLPVEPSFGNLIAGGRFEAGKERIPSMAYHLKAGETIPEGIKRIASEELEAAADLLSRTNPRNRDHAIHEARKNIKKTRAVLKLVRRELDAIYKKE